MGELTVAGTMCPANKLVFMPFAEIFLAETDLNNKDYLFVIWNGKGSSKTSIQFDQLSIVSRTVHSTVLN